MVVLEIFLVGYQTLIASEILPLRVVKVIRGDPSFRERVSLDVLIARGSGFT